MASQPQIQIKKLRESLKSHVRMKETTEAQILIIEQNLKAENHALAIENLKDIKKINEFKILQISF